MADIKKKVDSEWKKKAEEEKGKLEEVKEQLEEARQAQEGPLPPPTFLQFLAGLELEARMALGELKHPVTNEVRKDLHAAQYVIDTLAPSREDEGQPGLGRVDPPPERLDGAKVPLRPGDQEVVFRNFPQDARAGLRLRG